MKSNSQKTSQNYRDNVTKHREKTEELWKDYHHHGHRGQKSLIRSWTSGILGLAAYAVTQAPELDPTGKLVVAATGVVLGSYATLEGLRTVYHHLKGSKKFNEAKKSTLQCGEAIDDFAMELGINPAEYKNVK